MFFRRILVFVVLNFWHLITEPNLVAEPLVEMLAFDATHGEFVVL
jgi:hypothetical protein